MPNPFEQLEAATERRVEQVEAELSDWKLRALAAEDALLSQPGPAVLIRGDWKPKAERKNGYGVLQLGGIQGGAAVILDVDAVLMLCLALGIPAGRQ